MKSYQKVNHFPAMYQIARKTFLAKNLKRMRKLFPNEFKFFPRSWCVPAEISELRQYFYNKQNKIRQAKADQARRLLSPRNERN
jgi:tubulin polyglutamylase TTLL6/13